MCLYTRKLLCWYLVWSLILLSSSSNGGICPAKCNNCKSDSGGNIITAMCKDVKIPALPDTLEELTVSDASGMTAIMFQQFRTFVLRGKSELTMLKIQNYQIATLHGQCFQGSPSLLTLDLSKNQLIQISEENFEGLRNLSYLSLNQNKLTKLGDFVFRQLTLLESLNIALNTLHAIGENDFKGLTNLKNLDLQSNQIATIHIAAFQGLKSLRTINLKKNELTSIGPGLFGTLPNLQTLILEMNKIRHIDPESMINTSITFLNLMQNEITKMPTKFLQNISNENLDVNLARNNISMIDAGELQRIILKTLYLVRNSISIIHEDAMCYSFIETLDLQQNLLQHLPEGLQNSLNQSNTVLLDNNPWSCDCAIQWMQSLLRKGVLEPQCAQPLSYRGQKLSQILHDLEISCGDMATLPVPSRHFPVPPRLNPVTPHLEKKTTTCQHTITTSKQTTPQAIKTDEKGNNSTIAIAAGTVIGFILLVGFIVSMVIYLNMSKVKVAPDFSINCKKPDLNFRPRLKYLPQNTQYQV
ncbi:carboxypeptidase N subunit 2-like [Mercenaria mercenaria]|uniref:carboxypeptidase N subunit 2-like n=1 Tax=Mercenaria mercenaria TaxID=6596 RepID=UPI00234E6D8C|nr:carboxypeptidase N subunit 2-like [Mercenaria mercenaria]